MATILFDVDVFRAQFPGLFPDPPNTDAFIELFWDAATCYVSNDTAGALSVACRTQVLNLVTAHLITIMESAQAGNQPGFVVTASIDKISVTVQAPPSKSEFQFFLNQTPFGIQAYAMLYAAGVGGSYVGGFNELGSFRRAGGVFEPPSRATTLEEVLACPTILFPPSSVDIDYGTVATGTFVVNAIEIEAGCKVLVAGFGATAGLNIMNLYLYTGSDVDRGTRFNMYFWNSTARAAGDPPTQAFLNIDPTGLGFLTGFAAFVFAGAVVNEPNLVSITGVNSDITETLILRIENTS